MSWIIAGALGFLAGYAFRNYRATKDFNDRINFGTYRRQAANAIEDARQENMADEQREREHEAWERERRGGRPSTK